MDISLFEVVGPIMMGPSSSATAGMARIGATAHRFLTEKVRSIDLKFTPRFCTVYAGDRSHLAIIAGVLGLSEYDPRIKEALDMARAQGISVTTSVFKEPAPEHALTVKVTMGLESGKKCSVTCVSVGGGSIAVIGIDEFEVQLSGTESYLFAWSNHPMMGELETAFPGAKISMDEKGGKVLSYISLPEKELAAALEKAAAIPGVTRTYTIDPVIPLGYVPNKPTFTTYAELLELCAKTGKTLPELAIEYEINRSGRTREAIWDQMAEQLKVMQNVKEKTLTEEITPIYGFESGNDAKTILKVYKEGRSLSGSVIPRALATAIGTMEYSGAMAGCIVAVPTGGSSGILPGGILTLQEDRNLSDEKLIESMFVAAAMGAVMYYHGSTFSGSAGGCQAEVGVSSAITAGALTYLAGGTPKQVVEAVTFGIKNLMGLICDPFGCIEVPCIKRNGIGVTNAFASAEMALVGIESFIPADELIDSFVWTQKAMPVCLRGGGCGTTGTPTAVRTKQRIKEMDAAILLPLSDEE